MAVPGQDMDMDMGERGHCLGLVAVQGYAHRSVEGWGGHCTSVGEISESAASVCGEYLGGHLCLQHLGAEVLDDSSREPVRWEDCEVKGMRVCALAGRSDEKARDDVDQHVEDAR